MEYNVLRQIHGLKKKRHWYAQASTDNLSIFYLYFMSWQMLEQSGQYISENSATLKGLSKSIG